MIKANVKKHIRYYIAFSIVQILGLVVVILASGDKQTQLIAVLATTIFYFFFSILHNFHDHDLTPKIVLEYALVGCLGLAVYMFVFRNI